jgi:hypothetical protein
LRPLELREFRIRSALAAFAVSIAAHSSLEWQVRVGNMEPVVSSLRQIGLGGFALAGAAVAPVVSENTLVWAKVALDHMANAVTINAFIVANPSLLRQ